MSPRSILRHATLSLLGVLPGHGTQRRFLRGLYCHGLADTDATHFSKILSRLSNIWQFIDTVSALDIARRATPPAGRFFHFSVDDGFQNNLSVLAPILAKLSIPAIFFVPTDFMSGRSDAAYQFQLHAKTPSPIPMCSWADCRQLISAGFEIGSHTCSHPSLASISHDSATLLHELTDSKLAIERNTGQQCRYLAWPFGRRTNVNATVLTAVRAAGYDACFGAYRGRIAPRTTPDLFSLPRHQVEPSWPWLHAKAFALGRWGETSA